MVLPVLWLLHRMVARRFVLFGCYGLGDCTLVCGFNAIHINPNTGLPEVDEERCTACGVCVAKFSGSPR